MTDDEFKELVVARFARDDQFQRSVLERFDKTDGRLDKMDGRLDKIEGRLDNIEGRLKSVETLTAQIDVRLTTLERDEFHHYTSISRDLAQLRSDLTFHTVEFETRVGGLEQQMAVVISALAAIDKQLPNHERRLQSLEGAG